MNKWLDRELDYLISVKNNLWIAGLSSFGGSISLLAFNMPIIIKIVGLITGLTVSLGFFDNYLKKSAKIETIIKFLKKKGE